jgi:hypothetical protein
LLAKMGVFMLFEALAEEVPHVSENDKNEVGYVRCNQVEVGRFVHDGLRDRSPPRMTTDVTVGVISDASELGIPLCFLLQVS